MGDLATVTPAAPRPDAATGGGGELPPPSIVTAGPHILRRVAAEFPDELLYVGTVGHGHVAWLKSINMLAGPWEWVIDQGGEPIDFSDRRFSTRTDAAADLVATVEALIGAPAPAESDDAPEMVAAAPQPGAGSVDPDVVAMALDLAILTLRKVRSTFPAAARPRG